MQRMSALAIEGRMQSYRWALIAALLGTAIATPAIADPPKTETKNAGAKAGGAADKAADKTVKAAEKGADAVKDAGGKAVDKAEKGVDKANDEKPDLKADLKIDKEAIKKKAKDERAVLKGKVQMALKGKPMNAAMTEELKRHARRLARLDRISDLARAMKDDDAVDRAKKLTDKENDRHGKWMAKFDGSKPEGTK